MSASAVRILVVGHTSPSTLATLQLLEQEGWGSHRVDTVVEAKGALKIIRFDVVLAEENIGAGSGYDLTNSVLELRGTLLVSIALSEATLWLPVAQRGKRTLGDRALNASTLQLEVREALTATAGTQPSSMARKAPTCISDRASRLSILAMDRRSGSDGIRLQSVPARLERLLPPRGKPAAAAAISVLDEPSNRKPAKTGAIRRSDAPGRNFR
jgi:CheY-like chemotaxis protein